MYEGSSQVMTIVMVVMGDVKYNFEVDYMLIIQIMLESFVELGIIVQSNNIWPTNFANINAPADIFGGFNID